jgi:hypothetical protein
MLIDQDSGGEDVAVSVLAFMELENDESLKTVERFTSQTRNSGF